MVPMPGQANTLVEGSTNAVDLARVRNADDLDACLQRMLATIHPSEYDIREAYEYAMVLPESYYGTGSYTKWIKVGWALRNISQRLLVVWLAFSAQADRFQYSSIPELIGRWQGFAQAVEHGLTKRSIMYWAKQDALQDYEKVKSQTVDYYLDEAVNSQTEFDLAQVLKQMFKDKYVCSSLTGKGVWYVFKNHRWEPDKGLTLRMKISREMYHLLSSKSVRLADEMNHYDAEDKRRETIEKRIRIIHELGLKGHSTDTTPRAPILCVNCGELIA
jgi:hypothetical protein